MKIISIIGARPQFIKAAMLSKKLKEISEEIIIHTGQHYDKKMSDIFFEELGIPSPKYNLNIGSATHGIQTGKMLEEIEQILISESPDAVLVYGDTNSTLSGALAATKLHIPVIHVEAGLRSYNKHMPEEINRILTDHMSSYLLCPTITAIDNLRKENITNNVFLVGDIMKDAVNHYSNIAKSKYSVKAWIDNLEKSNDKVKLIEDGFYLATIHRAENTDDMQKMKIILESFNYLQYPVLLPLHPRTLKVIKNFNVDLTNTIIIEPVGYTEMLFLQMESIGIITDSGGIQKESYILKKPCTTLRDQTEWTETIDTGWNRLSSIHVNDIISNVESMNSVSESKYIDLYGDGSTAQKIIDIIERELRK